MWTLTRQPRQCTTNGGQGEGGAVRLRDSDGPHGEGGFWGPLSRQAQLATCHDPGPGSGSVAFSVWRRQVGEADGTLTTSSQGCVH